MQALSIRRSLGLITALVLVISSLVAFAAPVGNRWEATGINDCPYGMVCVKWTGFGEENESCCIDELAFQEDPTNYTHCYPELRH